MPTITNLVEIDAYLKTFPAAIDRLVSYEYLDAGDDFDKELQGFFAQRYKGPVLFLGMFEARLQNNAASLWENLFMGRLAVQIKTDGSMSKIQARNDAWEILLKVIGKIRVDCEDNLVAPGTKKYTFDIIEDTIRATDRVGSASAYGWDIDFNLGIPVNSHLFL